MAKIRPFKAVRPTRDKVSWVSCKSLDVYSKEKLKSKLDFNPYTFLHVVNPAYKYSNQETSVEKRFKLVKNRYLEFKENGILFKDKKEAFYIYKKITPAKKEYCGIITTTSLEDYRSNGIKKHEKTIKDREKMFLHYLKGTRFSAEPVLLTYPDNNTIREVLKKYTQTRAEYEFSTQDQNLHLVWIVDNKEDIKKIQTEFRNTQSLYIADGHHRIASSLLISNNLSKENPNHKGTEDYNYFMSYLLPESELKISEFNRFVTDLNGYTPETFLMELDTCFKITNHHQKLYNPKEKHSFSMYLNSEFYSLELRRSSYKFTDALSKLDAEILNRKILKTLLGIKDVRNDKRVHFLANQKNSLEMKTKVDDGTYAVSFGMKPVSFKELKNISEKGLIMPPKTTYIEPKIRSAMTIYEW